MQLGVEIGGTFTDLVWLDRDGRVQTGKVPSTPSEIEKAVLDAIESAGVPLAEISHFAHGSTVATNALLTRRGATTGLLTTDQSTGYDVSLSHVQLSAACPWHRQIQSRGRRLRRHDHTDRYPDAAPARRITCAL